MLIDFRNWIFNQEIKMLPRAQKELLERDFGVLEETLDCAVLKIDKVKAFSVADLFFENSKNIAVSPVKNIAVFYQIIDEVLAVKNKEIIDYTNAVKEELYFYGATCLVAHLKSEIALCGVNSKSDESLFEEYCDDFELTPLVFDLPEGLSTADVAFFVEDTLLICLEYVTDKKTKKDLLFLLKTNGIKIIVLAKEQVASGVLNIKFFKSVLLMTEHVYSVLTDRQKDQLMSFNSVIIKLPFLEKLGVKLRDFIL